jgi:predicted ferric reductase
MENKIKKYIIYISILVLYLTELTIIFLTGVEEALGFIYRLAGLFGLTSLFIAILSSSFMKQITKIFETTYIRMHHYFSILGILLVTLHPIAMAFDFETLTIFIPDFSSWEAFWEGAGRPALYIAYIAIIGVLIRTSIQKYWRYVHGLIYVTFLFGAIHGILVGDDLKNPFLFWIFIVMIVIVILNFAYKRYLKYKISKKVQKS